MRHVGDRKPATADDLKALPAALRPGGAKVYVDRINRTLVYTRPAAGKPDLMIKYVVRPDHPKGGNRVVTALRVAPIAMANPEQFVPI